MAELHGNELALHRALHEKALKLAPKNKRQPGEFWAAVLEPDKNVLDWHTENLHWFKVKGKHTVAKVQHAYHKKCEVMATLRQGDHVVSLTNQMQQINHFKDDIIVFCSTKGISGDDSSTTGRPPLQSANPATQNRMPASSQTIANVKPEPKTEPARIKAETILSTVSPNPFETPTKPRSLPQAPQFQTSTPLGSDLAEPSTPASRTTAGYAMFANAHRESHRNSKASPAEIEASLRRIWDQMTVEAREYFSKRALANSHSPAFNDASFSPAPVLETKNPREVLNPLAGSRPAPMTGGDAVMGPEKYEAAIRESEDGSSESEHGGFESEDGSSEPEHGGFESEDGSSESENGCVKSEGSVSGSEGRKLESGDERSEDESSDSDLLTAILAKTRLQKIIDDSSPAVLEAEVKKTNDFLNELKTQFNVPEAQSHQDAKHWLQQIETLQAMGVDTPTIIGVVGNTGAGKSSVVNAMLDEERLVPTNCMRACTAVVTEMSWNSSDDPNKKYRAEIEFIREVDWEKDLKLSLNGLLNDSGKLSGEYTNPEADAGVAYAKIKAVYPNMTKEMIEDSSVEEMLAKNDVQKVLGTTKAIEKSNPEFFYKELQRYVDSKEKSTGSKGKKADKEKRTLEFWPLIKVVRIFVKADALSTGAVIVDLPGVHDSNAARAAVAAGYMKQCTGLWVCAPINRAVDDKAAKSLLGESFKRQLKYDGQFSRITFICSKTDDISVMEASDSLGLEEVMAEDNAKIEEIDKKVDELNAKITEMKESVAVYSSIFSEADESFDVWDDLKKEIEDGKTVYAPKAKESSTKRKRSVSPRNSRKKIKKAGYEDDDDFIDDEEEQEEEEEALEDEIEVEEEVLDKGEPLTTEIIDNKLDELKDTKKKARKEKADILVHIKEVRRELKDFEEAKREIDTRMRAKCIDGRNKYSKGAIQQDFAAGIRELDNINAEEEDEENFDPENEIRDYEAVAQSLPVFCVSSRAYQQLNGKLQKDAKIPGFSHVEETEIPQLKAHCKKLTEAGRSANCRRYLNILLQIVLSLSLWANNDGTGIKFSDSEKDAEARWLQKKLKDLEDKLDDAVGGCIADMKDALNENLFEKFSDVIPLAVDQATQSVSKWGAPVNKFDRESGGLYWATYKAICRRDGGPYTNQNGDHDWNSQLIEPIMKNLASNWEKSFSRRLPSVLQGFTKRANEILKTFHRDVEARSRKNGAGIARLAMLSQQLRTYEATFSILTTEMVEAINTLQREANREFVPVVARKLASAYTWCANEAGGGQFKRMKDHMHSHVDQSRHVMFAESCDEVKKRLTKMCEKVEEGMNNKTDEVFVLMRRGYLQVLNGAQASGEVMPKWERHMRSEIARALERYEKDEAEKVATATKNEEASEDEKMEEAEAGENDSGENDEAEEDEIMKDAGGGEDNGRDYEEAGADDTTKDAETGDHDSKENEESAEGVAVPGCEVGGEMDVAHKVTGVEIAVELSASKTTDVETTFVESEHPADNEINKNKESGLLQISKEAEPSVADSEGLVAEALATGVPSTKDSPADSLSAEAAPAEVPSQTIATLSSALVPPPT